MGRSRTGVGARAIQLAVATAIALVTIPSSASEPPLSAPPGKVEWKKEWDRFTPNEGGITLAATVGAYVLDKRLPDYQVPNMDFEVPLLDPGVRGLMRSRDARTQEIWANWGDIGFRAIVLFPYIVDAGIVAGAVHRNVDVAAQLFLIDLQSFTLAGVSQLFASRMASRTRPFVQDCGEDGRATRRTCGESREHRSLYGGHASAAFTSAGLTCLHHQHIPLYGGGAPDTWACAWSLAFASLVSATRVIADEHWASDQVIGIATGWFYGYLLPKWLHYGSNPVGRSLGRLLAPRRAAGQSTGVGQPVVWSPTFKPVDDGGVMGMTAVF